MAFELVPYSDRFDLTEFYNTAKQKGFVNNSSKKMLIDSLSKEDRWQVWLLCWKGKGIGSTAAHSFPRIEADLTSGGMSQLQPPAEYRRWTGARTSCPVARPSGQP